ncbi:MAG: DUF4124 domain-containing protein [Agarilytica sp.]
MVKKLVIKATFMIIVFLGISQYFVYLMTGKSPVENFKMPSFSASDLKQDVTNMATGGKQTVYKWVDENGVTQYTAEPPPEQAAVSLELDPNANIIQGVEMPEDENAAPAKPKVSMPDGNIYNPKSIKKLMDDAQNVQQLLNDRQSSLDKMSGE